MAQPIKYHIRTDSDGVINIFEVHTLPTFEERSKLNGLNGYRPAELVIDANARSRLEYNLNNPHCLIHPVARTEIQQALNEQALLCAPIMPPTDFELVAHTDEMGHLTARRDVDENGPNGGWLKLTKGKAYRHTTHGYKYTRSRVKKVPRFNPDTGQWKSVDHKCNTVTEERMVQFVADDGCRFRVFPEDAESTGRYDLHEEKLWDYFERPVVKTVVEVDPQHYQDNCTKLDLLEILSNFEYYPGQRDYIARCATRDCALIGADVGTGKSLMAISLAHIKDAKRVLIIAPKGTVKGDNSLVGGDEEQAYDASQWFSEIKQFAPHFPVHEIQTHEDYYKLVSRPGGKLPEGIFITYPDAFFKNKSKEFRAAKGDSVQDFCEKYELHFDPNTTPDYFEGLGLNKSSGIYTVVSPSIATLIGDQWDMVLADEAHLYGKSMESMVGRAFHRLRAKYRYALTATPFPNFVTDVFALAGWLSIDDWHLGKFNSAWPFRPVDLNRFRKNYCARETDVTQKMLNQTNGDKGKTSITSPVIAKPAQLLKVLRPLVAYISKEQCNPDVVKCTVNEVRVPMGFEQQKLYQTVLQSGGSSLAKMYQPLMGVCTAPTASKHNEDFGEIVRSDFNPKTVTILQLINECLSRGEQVLVANSRIKQTAELARRLHEAGVSYSRIDSTVSDHAHESSEFKHKKTKVMLMGIRCAVGHSYNECPNMIIGSLDWSYGALHQAKGRVWRLNSKQPVNIWCVLTANSIEEEMFDRVGKKGDAATLCLHGKRVDRDYTPLSAEDVLTEHLENYSPGKVEDELQCEDNWEELKDMLRAAATLDADSLAVARMLEGKAVA